MKILETKSLFVSFSKTKVLNGISFDVSQGQTVGIIGPNGSGKTTLFNTLSGFCLPSSGTVRFKEKEITRVGAHTRAALGLGRVFQNFGIFKEMTLLENMLVAFEGKRSLLQDFWPWSGNARELKQQALQLLSQVGLSDKATAKASSLSGGQMRLLEIIRILAFGADLFLLDEPTAGVSPRMKGEVLGLIQKLRTLGKTILVIEHDLNFIESFCERILVLDQGQVILDDAPDKIRSNPQLQEIYFGVKGPQMA